MAIPITVPRLGWNMEQGVFGGWLRPAGATVRAGEPLFTLEGDKATDEVECLDGGILHVPANAPRQGDTVAVGAVLGYLLQPGEAIPAADALLPSPPVPRGGGAGDEGEAPALLLHSLTPDPSPPRAKGEGAASRSSGRCERPASSPRARRTAARLGIDWRQASGTGRAGRVRERDVLALQAEAPAGSTRRLIAERMLISHRSTAPVTLMTTIDATNLVQFRNRCQAGASGGDVVPSYTDLLVKLAARALERHPVLNARWEQERVVTSDRIHVGIAVDTEAGLLVPVLRDVPRLSVQELARRSRDLIERARQGKLSAGELRGGTFTVTSLGGLGIDAFTPLINVPECAVLGVGRIRRCPAVVEEQIVIRDEVTLSLTFDHRIVDGAPAARFLQTLAGLVANPEV